VIGWPLVAALEKECCAKPLARQENVAATINDDRV